MMNSSNNLKTGQKKLSVQLLLLAVVIILVAAVGLWINQSSTGGGFSGARANQSTAKLLKDIYATQTNLYKIQSMVATNQDKKELDKLSAQQAAIINDDINLVKKSLESDTGSEQKKIYSALQSNLLDYQKAVARYMELAPKGTGTPQMFTANEKAEVIIQLLAELAAFEANTGVKSGGSSGSMIYIVMIALIVLLVLSIIMIPSLVKNTMNNHVVLPLQETAGVLREFASGKFGKPLTWDADDAIGELVQSVNALRAKMSAPAAPAAKAASSEPLAAPTAPAAQPDERSLSGMIKKAPDQESLVMSSKKAIDKLQDI
jgi:methyl-accepting chemotaxis protein